MQRRPPKTRTFPSRRLALESLEQRVVLAVTPFSVSFPSGSAGNIDVAVNDGRVRIVNVSGVEPIVEEVSATGTALGTLQLSMPEGSSHATADKISDDGRWVRGMSYTSPSGGGGKKVYWDLNRPDEVFTELAPEIQQVAAAFDRDDDFASRVQLTSLERTTTLSIDGEIRLLKQPDGQSFEYSVTEVVNGVGGDPLTWIALGVGYSSGYSEPFLAFTDGTVMPLFEFIQQQQLNTGDPLYANYGSQIAIAGDSIFFVTQNFRSNCNEYICTDGLFQAGVTISALPLPESWRFSLLDINTDAQISPADALIVINAINDQAQAGIRDGQIPTQPFGTRIDVNRDDLLTPIDALRIINRFNELNASANSNSLEAEGEASSINSNAAIDEYFFDLVQPKRKANR